MRFLSIKLNKWLPIILLLITWYIPRQTAPGAYLENYLVLRWITFLVIPLIFIWFILHMLLSDTKIYVANIIFPMISVFGVIVFSGLINKSSLLEIAFTILIYLRYPLLFIVFLNMDIDKDVLISFLKVFFFLVIIQIPEVFYRFFFMGIKGDTISWTLGPWGHFDLGVYMIYATAIIVARDLIIRIKLSHIILIFCFFLVAAMGFIRMFMFFSPIVIGFVIYNCFKNKKLKKKFYIAIVILTVMVVGFIFSVYCYGKVFPESRVVEDIVSMMMNPKEIGRVSRINALPDIISKVEINTSNFLIGWGPGSSLAGEYLAERGKFFKFTTSSKTQLVETFVDVGIVGIITYFWLLVCLILEFRKHINVEDNETYIFLNHAIIGMWLFYTILGPVYDIVWRHDSPNFIFYFLAAVIYNRYRNIKNKNFSL